MLNNVLIKICKFSLLINVLINFLRSEQAMKSYFDTKTNFMGAGLLSEVFKSFHCFFFLNSLLRKLKYFANRFALRIILTYSKRFNS